MLLTKREKEILRSTVELYIETGGPVSSRMVAKRHKGAFSTATFRNEMLSLEEKGFLVQVHAQSGRIPTPRGITYYVKNMISSAETERPFPAPPRVTEYDRFWESVSEDLSFHSQNAGFVLTPSFFSLKFSSIRLLRVGENRCVIVLETLGKLVSTRVVSLESDISQNDLDLFSQEVNLNFRGYSLEDVLRHLYLSSREQQRRLHRFLSQLKNLVLSDHSPFDLFFRGEERLLDQIISKDMEKIKELISVLENRRKLVSLLRQAKGQDEVTILFAPDLGDDSFDNFTLVVSEYKVDDQSAGRIGVLGFPMMNYPRVYTLVKEMARNLSGYLYPPGQSDNEVYR